VIVVGVMWGLGLEISLASSDLATMTRFLSVKCPDAVYHMAARGNARVTIDQLVALQGNPTDSSHIARHAVEFEGSSFYW
jgi:hypothetical protein